MKLEVGKKYELNNGNVRECEMMYGDDPLAIDGIGFGPFVIGGVLYHQDGTFAAKGGSASEYDVKREFAATTRDPEPTEPYGDSNHPLPPETGTLKELKVQPGDVVEGVMAGQIFTVREIDNDVARGQTIYQGGRVVEDDTWGANGMTWTVVSRAADLGAETAEAKFPEGYGAPVRPSAPDDCADDEGWSDWTSDADWDVSQVDVQMECIDGIHRTHTRPRKPKRETVTLYGPTSNYSFTGGGRSPGDTHRITFTTKDGKPATGTFRNDAGDEIILEVV